MNVINKIETVIHPADVLIIVPPFASIDRTCLAAHILKACSQAEGIQVEILYANILFASLIGETNYYHLCYTGLERDFLGERFFSRVAYGKPAFGNNGLTALERMQSSLIHKGTNFNIAEIWQKEHIVDILIDDIICKVLKKKYPIIGFTNSFDQTSSSIALINAIKKTSDTICIMGGSNCLGEMAEGLATLSANIDYIFSGEAETTFPEFIKNIKNGINGKIDKIIRQDKFTILKKLPKFTCDEYFLQLETFLSDSKIVTQTSAFIQYETSRGCWKGQNQPCFFCGLNGPLNKYRMKDYKEVISDISSFVKNYPTRKIAIADCIIPPSFFQTFLPELKQENLDLKMTYEVRSNISFNEMVIIKDAGIEFIQPGIESLSTSHLKKMNKNVSSSDNIRFLRWAKQIKLFVSWYLIYDIPNESLDELEEINEIIPWIEHLDPPRGFVPLRIDRFSTYFNQSHKFDIEKVYPWPIYKDIFPNEINIDKIAYHFSSDYKSASRENPDLVSMIKNKIVKWKTIAEKDSDDKAQLTIQYIKKNKFLLIDTRSSSINNKPQVIDYEMASAALLDIKDVYSTNITGKHIDWAISRKLITEIDDNFISLVVPDKETIESIRHYTCQKNESNIECL